MTHWTTLLTQSLRGPLKPRVYRLTDLESMATHIRPTITKNTLRSGLTEMIQAGQIQKINNSLFINLLSIPKPDCSDAASWLREGAVLSLHSVLGDSGILNNPSRIITAVVPLSCDAPDKPKLGVTTTSTGVSYHFFGLPSHHFYSEERGDDISDFYSFSPKNGTPRATIEKALLDYIYLGYSPRSNLTPLPKDIDINSIDYDRLMRMGKLLNVMQPLERFLAEYQNLIPETDALPQILTPSKKSLKI